MIQTFKNSAIYLIKIMKKKAKMKDISLDEKNKDYTNLIVVGNTRATRNAEKKR